MRLLHDVLRHFTAEQKTTTLAVVSAIGQTDAASTTALLDCVDGAVGVIVQHLAKHNPERQVRLCHYLGTAIEVQLAGRLADRGNVSPLFIAPTDPDRLRMAGAAIPDIAGTLKYLLSDPSRITSLDFDNAYLDRDSAEPTNGHLLLIRRSDLVVVVAPDFSSAATWLTSVKRDIHVTAQLVMTMTPTEGQHVGVLDADSGAFFSIEIEALRVLLVRRYSMPTLAKQRVEPFTKGPRFSIGGVFNLFLMLIGGRKPPQWHFVFGRLAHRAETSLAWPRELGALEETDRAQLTKLRRQFSVIYAWADAWAIHYGNLFRTVCLFLVISNVAAVTAAVLGYFDVSRGKVWHTVELLSLVAVAILYVSGRRTRIHQKWLEYRLFAELLRPAPYYWAMADVYSPREPAVRSPERDWWTTTVLLYHDVLSSIEHPRIHMTKPYVYGLKALVEDFIQQQVTWHAAFAERHAIYHGRLVSAGKIAFWSILAAAAMHVVQRLVGDGLMPIPARAEALLAACSVSVACVLATFGFATGILIHQLGFDHIAERSSITAARLRSLVEKIQTHRGAVRFEHLNRWISECSDVLTHEQNAWFRQMSKISIHL